MKLKMKSQLKDKKTLALATKIFLLLQNNNRNNLQSKIQMFQMDSNTSRNGLTMNILTKLSFLLNHRINLKLKILKLLSQIKLLYQTMLDMIFRFQNNQTISRNYSKFSQLIILFPNKLIRLNNKQ